MQSVNVTKSDSQIQQDVLCEFKWNTRVAETEVGVEVDKGVVTLSGTVSSYAKRLAAQEAAHRVAGVLDVANDLKIHSPTNLTRTDTEIAQAVRNTLEWDVVVPDTRIRSTVSSGVVMLEGEVNTWHEREAAKRAVRNLAGVHGVLDRIEVRTPQTDAERIRKEIEAALERRADQEANHIQVEVKDGIVTLSGPIHSWDERNAILGAAWYMHGVRMVEDHLRQESY